MQLIDTLLSFPLLFEWQQKLFNNYGAIKEEFKEDLNVSGKEILDIGCSTGICASHVVALEQNRYVGVDVEQAYVEIAAKRYPTKATFLQMDAGKLEFEENRFDRILFFSVLHHMEDGLVRDCFKQVRRVLKNDGKVLVAEPIFADSTFSNILLKLDRGRYIRPPEGYRKLFSDFKLMRAGTFKHTMHQFCSFVLTKG